MQLVNDVTISSWELGCSAVNEINHNNWRKTIVEYKQAKKEEKYSTHANHLNYQMKVIRSVNNIVLSGFVLFVIFDINAAGNGIDSD